jgi:hypothetical protein
MPGLAVGSKRLRIRYRDGSEETLNLKPHAEISPMELHRMARPGTLAIIFHEKGCKVIKGRSVAAVDFIVDNSPWDYDDPLN